MKRGIINYHDHKHIISELVPVDVRNKHNVNKIVRDTFFYNLVQTTSKKHDCLLVVFHQKLFYLMLVLAQFITFKEEFSGTLYSCYFYMSETLTELLLFILLLFSFVLSFLV